MTKEQRTTIALYHIANVSNYLSRHTKDLEEMYALAKRREYEATSQDNKDYYASQQVDLMTAILIRRQYGLMG